MKTSMMHNPKRDFNAGRLGKTPIAILESFNNRNLQRLSPSICSICTQIFFETRMIEQRSG
jgi:hypothetical protein